MVRSRYNTDTACRVFSCLPRTVPLPEKMIIVDCWCGHDGTMLYSETASLLACGSNEHNKLGLNQRQGFLNVMKSRAGKVSTEPQKHLNSIYVYIMLRVYETSVVARIKMSETNL